MHKQNLQRCFLSLLGGAMLLLPTTTFGLDVENIDLLYQQAAAQKIASARMYGETLYLSNVEENGSIIFQLKSPIHVSGHDRLRFTLESSAGNEALFLWAHPDAPETFYQQPFTLSSGAVTLDLMKHPEWKGAVSHIGIAFPNAMTSLGIAKDLTFERIPFGEKFQAFVLPEELQPSSINTLKGSTFGSLSLVHVAAALFVLSAGALGVLSYFSKKVRVHAVSGFCFIVLLCFALYDARFTLDLGHIWTASYLEYSSQNPEKRSFATVGDFYGYLAFVEDAVSKGQVDGNIAFIPNTWPYKNYSSYLLYPKHIDAESITEETKYIAVYDAANVEYKDGSLILGSEVLCTSCERVSYRNGADLYMVKEGGDALAQNPEITHASAE